MIEVLTHRLAVGERETNWIVDLYGGVDQKYADPEFVRHQFAGNPLGWSLHAFALDGEVPVGHCALLPLPARLGTDTVVAGKFEAFAVRPEYQSAALENGRLIGLGLLADLYARARDEGFSILHDLAAPDLGVMHRLHGAQRVPIPWRTFIGVGDRRVVGELQTRRALAATSLAALQSALRRISSAVADSAVVRMAEPTDAPPARRVVPTDAWTLDAPDIWEWLVGSGLLAWVDEPSGGRALVRVPGPARQAAELLDWSPGSHRFTGAVAAIAEVAQLGGEGRSVRVGNTSDDPGLKRAARALGLVTSRRPQTLYVKTLHTDIDASNVVVTPYFFATF